MYEYSKEGTACLGCASTNMHGLGVLSLATPRLRRLASTLDLRSDKTGKTLVPPGTSPPPTSVLVPGWMTGGGESSDVAPGVSIDLTDEVAGSLGPPPWIVPLAVGVGGLALVGGILVILKKKGKI